MKQTALVLEGGGMRGAYTAGALSWLLENNIEFDKHYGISTGAIYLAGFLLKNPAFLKKAPYYFISDGAIGLKALLKEGRYVAYNYLFGLLENQEPKLDIEKLNKLQENAYFGVYDLKQKQTVFYSNRQLDAENKLLKAACTLPIIGRIIKYQQSKFLDGGITVMIPIEKALDDGCNDSIVIATKPLDYIRKKASFLSSLLMRIIYFRHKCIYDDYQARHLNYQKQIGLIKDQISLKQALYICPSKSLKISRLSGDEETIKELFELGYNDMQANKEVILKLLKSS